MTDVAKKPQKARQRAVPAAGETFVKVTLVRSLIGTPRDQRETAKGLGLRKPSRARSSKTRPRSGA